MDDHTLKKFVAQSDYLIINNNTGEGMKKFTLKIMTIMCAVGVMLMGSINLSAKDKFVTINTGKQTGVHYNISQFICKQLSHDREQHGIQCAAPSSTDKLRAVFSMPAKPFIVVARKEAKISNFEDLKGKRVNIGNPGSVQRGTFAVLVKEMGWDMKAFSLDSKQKADERAQALCTNEIDAIVYIAEYANYSVNEVATRCATNLVNVSNATIDKLIDKSPFYTKIVIPGGTYIGTGDDTTTLGVRATFISSSVTSAEVIYHVTKAVFENFNEFKALHPTFDKLQENNLIESSSRFPLHDGVVKYYKERGWISNETLVSSSNIQALEEQASKGMICVMENEPLGEDDDIDDVTKYCEDCLADKQCRDAL